MIRNMLYAIGFAVLTLAVAAQTDPLGHPLTQGYKGLLVVEWVLGLMFLAHVLLFVRGVILDEED